MNRTRTICLLSDERVHAVRFAARGRRREIIARGQVEFRIPDSLLVDHNVDELVELLVNNAAAEPNTY